jgi:hypothetical protein
MCDKKSLQVLWCDIIFSQGSGIENTTRWIKFISHHKPWEFLYIHIGFSFPKILMNWQWRGSYTVHTSHEPSE